MFSLERPYKSCQPVQTINKIRNILADFDGMLYETFWGNPYEEIFSVRVETDLADGSFGTNGKGRNRLYTLASAYAEFIERLQNGMLFYSTNIPRMLLNELAKENGFYFQPDERFITEAEFAQLPEPFLQDLFGENQDVAEVTRRYFQRLKENRYPGCLAVPFYDVKNRTVIHIPYFLTQFITGSTGMAAGNTLAEALFQGLCEILERYAASLVFFNQLTPPTVSRSFLAQFKREYRIIQTIEQESGWEVVVKDFSCGQKLPVVGVMIIDRHRGKYKLNVGSDTSFVVALSRALTEIHQGYNQAKDFDQRMLDIPRETDALHLNTDPDSNRKLKDRFKEFTKDGSGVFPQSLFAESATYAFDPGVFKVRKSYESEVKYLTELILGFGCHVYFRDVSFLGFPAVYIYVTTISLLGKKESYLNLDLSLMEQAIDLDSVEDMFFPLQSADEAKLQKMAAIFESLTKDDQELCAIKNVIKLEFSPASDWYNIPVSFFLVLFRYRLGDLEKAIRSLERFMAETDNSDTDYYLLILRFFKELHQGVALETITAKVLSEGVNPQLVNETVAFLAHKSRIFDQVQLPNCPHCHQCPLSQECITRNKLNFNRRFQRKMKTTPIDQRNLREIV